MAMHHHSTGSEIIRWQPQHHELVPSVKTSAPTLIKHTGKMASDNNNAPPGDGLRNYKQKMRDLDLSLNFAALMTGKPRNEEEEGYQEAIRQENEMKNSDKNNNNNKWMILSPIYEPKECTIEVQYDTGAVQNFITEHMVQLMGLEKERLDHPQEITTATGPAGVCEYHVSVIWRGQPGCNGEINFFVLPGTSDIPMPLIGTDAKKCWDEFLDERPKGIVYYTALSKEKASERIQTKALRDKVQNEQSELQHKKEVYEERRGGSSSKSKGSRANEKKPKRS